jgi:predicted glutamine amidotransferase
VETACAWVAAQLPLYAINFVLAGPDGLWALRYPETHPLYLLERAPGEPLRHASSLGMRVHADEGAERPLAVLASERMDADPGWRMLAQGELLHISDTLEVRTRRILDGPPAHLLTLEELSPTAQASQTHTAP